MKVGDEMSGKVNVQFVVAEIASNKVLYIKTVVLELHEVSIIGEKAMELKNSYYNCYVLVKLC